MARTPSDTSGAYRVGERPLAALPERELVARCNQGERVAHDELYHRFRRVVAANLFRALGDRQELEDLVQEVFVIAFRGLANFRHEAQLATWLYRICVNVAYGRMRTKGRRPPPLFVENLEELSAQSSAIERPESPERAMQRREDQARVYAALAKLPPKKRIVLYLHEIEGRDLKDIASLIDSNPVTVRTRLFYAKREFYKFLTEIEAGGDDASRGPILGEEAR